MNDIVKLHIADYYKCNNIWDMKKCPFTDKFYEEIKSGNRIVFIYKIDDEFIGEGALVLQKEDYTIPNQRIYLSRLIVKKEYRNQGIGTQILDYLLKTALKMGYSEISLGVDCDNKNAVHLYKKFGFEIYKKAKDEYGDYFKMLKKL